MKFFDWLFGKNSCKTKMIAAENKVKEALTRNFISSAELNKELMKRKQAGVIIKIHEGRRI